MGRYAIILGKKPPLEKVIPEVPMRYAEGGALVKNWAVAVGIGGLAPSNILPRNTGCLIYETARKKLTLDDINFIDLRGNLSAVSTNIVEFSCAFSEVEACGALNEVGLFDTDKAELVYYRTFVPIIKTNSMTLTIPIRIHF
jgi:hypothetical protein